MAYSRLGGWRRCRPARSAKRWRRSGAVSAAWAPARDGRRPAAATEDPEVPPWSGGATCRAGRRRTRVTTVVVSRRAGAAAPGEIERRLTSLAGSGRPGRSETSSSSRPSVLLGDDPRAGPSRPAARPGPPAPARGSSRGASRGPGRARPAGPGRRRPRGPFSSTTSYTRWSAPSVPGTAVGWRERVEAGARSAAAAAGGMRPRHEGTADRPVPPSRAAGARGAREADDESPTGSG